MGEPGTFEEIPASKIETCNPVCDFSPIKFSVSVAGECEEILAKTGEIVDEEITFGMMARKTESKENGGIVESGIETDKRTAAVLGADRLQRRSEEDVCNTPKRERHEDQKLNIRSARLLEMDKAVNDETEGEELKMTPSKKNNGNNGEIVKSLSIEFEQRLASIQVSPRPANNSTITSNSASKPVRSMSPIRSIAQLSPVSKLNLNDEGNEESCLIETPKLVSPSKIAATPVTVTAAAAVDVEKIKSELEAKWAKQVEFLQFEVSTLQEKYESSIKGNAEMRTMLVEYEKTLAQFIDARRTRPDQHSSIDQLVQDKKKLELEIQTLQISYQNLHQRYEDMKGLQEQAKINDATLRQSIQLLQQELATTVRTLENTRRAYEDKIEKSNTEAKNTKEALEYELSATKAKLLKSELKISSLETAIETKTRENSELMTICDELIHKMDKRCT